MKRPWSSTALRHAGLLPRLLVPMLVGSIGCEGQVSDPSGVSTPGTGGQGFGIGSGIGNGSGGTASGAAPSRAVSGAASSTGTATTGTGPIGTGGAGGGAGPSGNTGAAGSGTSTTTQPGGASVGLPCDVQTLLANRCQTCHGAPPAAGAPSTLITYQNLTAPSKSDPTKSEAEMAVARMQNTVIPMPPKPGTPATAAEVGTLQAWIAAGYPTGSCGASAIGGGADGGVAVGGGADGGAAVGGAGDAVAAGSGGPFAAAPVCTSNVMSRGGEGATMDPGMACINCHSRGEGPRFAIAGTVYPTAHEPDQCNGANGNSGIQVVITGADGKSITLNPNAVGNFSSSSVVATPYQAKLVYMGRERLMVAAQTSGDCNSCHTQSGANAAPGRLLLP